MKKQNFDIIISLLGSCITIGAILSLSKILEFIFKLLEV